EAEADVVLAGRHVGHHRAAQPDIVGPGEGLAEEELLAGGDVFVPVEVDAADAGVHRRNAAGEADRGGAKKRHGEQWPTVAVGDLGVHRTLLCSRWVMPPAPAAAPGWPGASS